MKVLFATSEHPKNQFGGLGSFTREITSELKKLCDLKTVYFHYGNNDVPQPDNTIDYVLKPKQCWKTASIGENILENSASLNSQLASVLKDFSPDVIHCNDRQTFLPFRFNKNVVYSSHLMFTDLLGISKLDDVYFNELKIERLALEKAKAVIAYSDFSADRITKNVCAKQLFILPLGFKPAEFYSNKNPNVLNIAYFGRFENLQKGYIEFINAVNKLGLDFKTKYKINYSLYGRGEIPKNIDTSLFDFIGFLKTDELKEAYSKTDIVVMPSKYEPFGLTGLEAMAAEALLLCTKDNGMDAFTKPDETCITIPSDSNGIAEVLNKVVSNFNSYLKIRKNGKESVQKWTWERSAKAHYEIYKKVFQDKTNLSSYSFLQNKAIEEKVLSAEQDEITKNSKETINEISYLAEKTKSFNLDKNKISLDENKIAFFTLVSQDKGICKNANNIHIFKNNSLGIKNSLNMLFIDDKEYKTSIIAGCWETSTNPKESISELCRITQNDIFIFYKDTNPYSWQSFLIEDFSDWKKLIPQEYSVEELKPEIDSSIKCVRIFPSFLTSGKEKKQ